MLIAMASIALLTSPIGQNMAMGDESDAFGVKKIYPTKEGGREWYVNMDEPRSDSLFKNLENLELTNNGDSWHVSADQVRMEAWSEENEKWTDVEVTAYAKLESGSTELLQLYSRGGHHTDRDQCEGSAYKARLYGNGVAAWTKEITHPAYAGNRGLIQATETPLEDRWVGFKAVIYNVVEDGEEYVRLESYIDDDVTDSDGDLVVANNWELASVVEDRGDWATDNGDFNDSCGRERDEILLAPGGTDAQNIVGFRTDTIDWSFKYLSAREIDPLAEQEPELPEPSIPEPEIPVENPQEPPVVTPTTPVPMGIVVTNSSQYAEGTTAIGKIDMLARKLTTRTSGDIAVAVMQNGNVLAISQMQAANLDLKSQYVSLPIGPVSVSGSYQVAVYYYGSGAISAAEIMPSAG
jgi:hypothetical protein